MGVIQWEGAPGVFYTIPCPCMAVRANLNLIFLVILLHSYLSQALSLRYENDFPAVIISDSRLQDDELSKRKTMEALQPKDLFQCLFTS